jgi:Mg-chelatase subunit ChlD
MSSSGAAAREVAVLVFRDTGANSPHYKVATVKQVGGVYGLAYSGCENAIYAAAYQKRQMPFGPGGPGAIYRIDLGTGDIAQPIDVPDAGENRHDANLHVSDRSAIKWVGKNSLGDIDLSGDESELYAVNLADRQIYRFRIPSGRNLGSFGHGAASEPWAAEARPFGLTWYEGRLYHSVVHSAEESAAKSDLALHVYSSLPDGSDMREVGQLGLNFSRGQMLPQRGMSHPIPQFFPIDWNPWSDAYPKMGPDTMVHPMPIGSDIEFDNEGNIVVGLRDRHTDMGMIWEDPSNGNEPWGEVVFGEGDTLLGTVSADRWSIAASPEHFDDAVMMNDEATLGGLAALDGGRVIASNAWGSLAREQLNNLRDNPGALWFDAESGQRMRHEAVCRTYGPQPRLAIGVPSLAHAHNEWVELAGSTGDVEVLCGGAAVPTPTASATSEATPMQTDTPTVTSAPSATATPTATLSPRPTSTATGTPRPSFLPLALREKCVHGFQYTDVALVIDASTSMLDETREKRTKLAAAVEAVELFLDELALPLDQAAIVQFNSEVELLQPLTGNRSALVASLDRIEVQRQTRIDLGVSAARMELASPRRNRENGAVMVVLTDGLANPVGPDAAVREAALAKDNGVTIFAIGLGEDLDLKALEEMVSKPGYFYRAPDAEDLKGIYAAIAVEIPCPAAEFWGRR